MNDKTEKLIDQLHQKFGAIGQDLNVHLEGLLYAKPITYWDYIQTDALLSCKPNALPSLTKWFLSCIIR